jgi:hypothetical protein
MILNLLLIVFVIGTAVLWATYGLFSAFLHLCVTIVAAALAFATWELWVYKLLIGTMPMYAWGVGLIAPFVLYLFALRLGLDRLIRGNMQFPRLADQIAGAACGAGSGVIAAGVLLIGVGFLPLPPAIAGYRPYEVVSNGAVEPVQGEGLWLPADKIAAGLYVGLSDGAFSSSNALVDVMPEPVKQASEFRLGKQYDENQSVTASPETVGISGVYRFAEEQIPGVGPQVQQWIDANLSGGNQLLTLGTVYKLAQGTTMFDTDSVLRLAPVQVRLLVENPDSNGPDFLRLAPIGFSKPLGDSADFYPISNNQISATSTFPEAVINWVFVVPSNAKPTYLEVRHTRFELPEAQTLDGPTLGTMLGKIPDAPASEDNGENNTTARTGGMEITDKPQNYTRHVATYIEQSSRLPKGISKNRAQGINYETDGTGIISGTVLTGTGAGRGNNNLDHIQVSENLRPIRLQVRPTGAETFVGKVGQGDPAANIQEIWLSDTNGRQYFPFAYVHLRGDGRMNIRVEDIMFRNNSELPLNDMRDGDELYIYFRPPPNVTINQYHIGNSTQNIGFEVSSENP